MTRFRKGILIFAGLLLITAFLVGVQRVVTASISTVILSDTTLPVIIVDPGHGGIDGGAVGVDGIVEKDINLAIALKLRDMLIVGGFEVVMTREEDISIHDDGVTGIRQQKVSDLRNRLAMTTQFPNVIYVSIHQNKFGSSEQSGMQVFYGRNHENSRELAEVLQRNGIDMLPTMRNRQPKEGGRNLFIIYEAQCPAVLIECGFLSNPEEARRLVDPDYQARIAFVVFRSIVEYVNLQLIH